MNVNQIEGTDQAAKSADDAIKSTRRAASKAYDSLADTAEDVGREIAPSLKRTTEHARALAQAGMEAVRDGSVQLRGQAKRASETTMTYIKAEPVKAMLIAAAVGATVGALLSRTSRRRDVD